MSGNAKTAFTGRKPLREDVAALDAEILRLLLKRHNLLEKMRRKNRLEPGDEKYLREAWQKGVAKVSRDPALSGAFFTLMQGASFLPKPVATPEENAPKTTGPQRREAFNLAPSRQPVNFSITAPLSGFATQSWLYLAAASGKAISISPSLQNDSLSGFLNTLKQMEIRATRENASITLTSGAPLPHPDIVIHVGESEFNFYLFLAHYLGHHSRVKINGGDAFKLKDLSALRHALPTLGARMTNVIPKSDGLPIRLECSGILPPTFDFSEELSPFFGEALMLASPFYEAPFGINFNNHPLKKAIFSRVLPILTRCGAVFELDNYSISFQPSSLTIPEKPALPLEPRLAAFLFAFVTVLTGKGALKGFWPEWQGARFLWESLLKSGLTPLVKDDSINASTKNSLKKFTAEMPTCADLPVQAPILAALAGCACLNGGEGSLPMEIATLPECADFLNTAGLSASESGILERLKNHVENPVWNAPSAEWAMALALAACVRPAENGFRLGNPGVITGLWPGFWAFYNGLPNPKQPVRREEPAAKSRRRIITNDIAIPPEITNED